MNAQLHALAQAAGVEVQWRDYRGEPREVAPEALEAVLDALGLPAADDTQRARSLERLALEDAAPAPLRTARLDQPFRLPEFAGRTFRLDFERGGSADGVLDAHGHVPLPNLPGYHRLHVQGLEPFTLALAPARCVGLEDLGARTRRWALAVQVPSLRRDHDLGIGDLGALPSLARTAATHGADALALSPLHAGFGAWPDRFMPYSPSTRLALNPLLGSAEMVLGEAAVHAALEREHLHAHARALEAASLIDVGAASRLKLRVLRALHAQLDALGQRARFEAWRASAPAALRLHARFEALHAYLHAGPTPQPDWRQWPQAWRDPQGIEVQRFADAHRDDIEWHEFQQWIVDQSLASAQAAAREAGMAIGLMADLAVGTDPVGSHGWSEQDSLLGALRIGAPPDALNRLGQDWGLAAMCPRALRRSGYRAFIALLRASLRHVGGVRLDHVFGLHRLWLIPPHAQSAQGAYLRYPLEDLLQLIALESWRHRALVVGEDLGTIPDGFQPQLIGTGLLGMRVLFFQRDAQGFTPPAQWPERVVALTTTHDLPTVAGWWRGRDIDWSTRLNLLEPGRCEAEVRDERAQDRAALWRACVAAGVAQGEVPAQDEPAPVVRAAAAFIGQTASQLAVLPLEDALALDEQPNLPGTQDEHPNWRRRLPCTVESLAQDARFTATLDALHAQRETAP